MSEEYTLSIMGRKITFEEKMVPIHQLHFYLKNPRVATIVSEHKNSISNELIDFYLWERNETHKLKRAIEYDGGLIHPILVYNNDVLEGNTRLCCYRHLHLETKDERWSKIRCHIISEQLSQEEIYRLLCTEHISGKIEWDAYDKANLFYKMKNEDGMTLTQINSLVGESTSSISNKINAYELMVANGVIEKDKYSHFEQLVTSGAIREIKKQDPDIVEKVIVRIKDGTIRKATDIRSIGTIYKHKEARKRVFQDGEDVEQVYHDVKAKSPMTDSPVIKEIEILVRRVRSITREEREAIAKSNRDKSKVEQLTKELLTLCREMGIKIHVPKNMKKG